LHYRESRRQISGKIHQHYAPFLEFNVLDVYSSHDRSPIIDISQSNKVMEDVEEHHRVMDHRSVFSLNGKPS